MQAPETRLNLELLGLFATAEGGGLAIIADGRGNARVYTVEETLPGGATLKQVLADRIILEREGRLETLRLPERRSPVIDYAAPAAGGRPPAGADSRAGAGRVADSLARWRERAIRDPSRIVRMLGVEPVEDANGFVGYRLTPRMDDPLFTQAGLMPGDVVTEINGLALTSPRQGMLALRRLTDARELSMTVLRNGQPVHIHHSLEQPGRGRDGCRHDVYQAETPGIAAGSIDASSGRSTTNARTTLTDGLHTNFPTPGPARLAACAHTAGCGRSTNPAGPPQSGGCGHP